MALKLPEQVAQPLSVTMNDLGLRKSGSVFVSEDNGSGVLAVEWEEKSLFPPFRESGWWVTVHPQPCIDAWLALSGEAAFRPTAKARLATQAARISLLWRVPKGAPVEDSGYFDDDPDDMLAFMASLEVSFRQAVPVAHAWLDDVGLLVDDILAPYSRMHHGVMTNFRQTGPLSRVALYRAAQRHDQIVAEIDFYAEGVRERDDPFQRRFLDELHQVFPDLRPRIESALGDERAEQLTHRPSSTSTVGDSMRAWGAFVLARSSDRVDQLSAVAQYTLEADALTHIGPWQVAEFAMAEVLYTDAADNLPDLVAATGAPAMIGFSVDDDCLWVASLLPTDQVRYWCVGRESTADYLAEDELGIDVVFTAPAEAVAEAVAWAQAGDFAADHTELAAVFMADTLDEIESGTGVSGLLSGLGLARSR